MVALGWVDHPLGPFSGHSSGAVHRLPGVQKLWVRLTWIGFAFPEGTPTDALFETWMSTSIDGINWAGSEAIILDTGSSPASGVIEVELGLDAILRFAQFSYRLTLGGDFPLPFCFGLECLLKEHIV